MDVLVCCWQASLGLSLVMLVVWLVDCKTDWFVQEKDGDSEKKDTNFNYDIFLMSFNVCVFVCLWKSVWNCSLSLFVCIPHKVYLYEEYVCTCVCVCICESGVKTGVCCRSFLTLFVLYYQYNFFNFNSCDWLFKPKLQTHTNTPTQ